MKCDSLLILATIFVSVGWSCIASDDEMRKATSFLGFCSQLTGPLKNKSPSIPCNDGCTGAPYTIDDYPNHTHELCDEGYWQCSEYVWADTKCEKGKVVGWCLVKDFSTLNSVCANSKAHIGYAAPVCDESLMIELPPPPCDCPEDECSDQCKTDLTSQTSSPLDGDCGSSCSESIGPSVGDPVAVLTGNFTLERQDLELDAGTWTQVIRPYYNAERSVHTVHGMGWHSVLGMRVLRREAGGYTLRDAKGYATVFAADSGTDYPHVVAPVQIDKSARPLQVLGNGGPYLYRDGARFYYFGKDGALDSITDGKGQGVRLSYVSDHGVKTMFSIHGISLSAIPRDFRTAVTMDYRVTRMALIRKPEVGIDFSYDSAGYLDLMTDAAKRMVRYTYDHDSTVQVGRLVRVDGLDGAILYEYSNSGFRHIPTAWNNLPLPISYQESGLLTNVAKTINVIENGRVSQQQAGGRTIDLKILTNQSNSFVKDSYTCTGRRMRVQQTTKNAGQTDLVEVFSDTAYSCVKPGTIDTVRGGWQWSETSNRKAFYGQTFGTKAQKWVYVRERRNPSYTEVISRDSLGQDTLRLVVDSTGGFKDTAFTYRRFDNAGNLIFERQGKRYKTDTKYNDSASHSYAYNATGHLVDEWLWKHAGDSTQGKMLIRHVDYNADGTTSAEDVDGVRVEWRYSGSTYPGKPSEKVWPNGSSVKYVYDAIGRATSETDAAGGVTQTLYNSSGRDSLRISPDSVITRWSWQGRLKTSETIEKYNADTRTRIWRYNNLGLDTAEYVVDHLDTILVSRREYDAAGRLKIEGNVQVGKITEHQYDNYGRKISVTTWPSESTALKRSFSLDSDGRVTKETLPNGDMLVYTLDGQGNKVAERHQIKSGTTMVQVSSHSARYDWRNLLVMEADSLSASTQLVTLYRYDGRGNLVRRIGFRNDTTLWNYDTNGRLVWERSTVGMWTHHAYDVNGREVATIILAKSSVPDTASIEYVPQAGDRVTQYSYDAMNRITMWTQNGQLVRKANYYSDGKVKQEQIAIDAANNLWLQNDYAWLPTGELKSIRRTGDMYTEYVYNSQGQKVAELAKNGNGGMDTAKTWAYDTTGRLQEERTPGLGGMVRTYDNAGRMIGMVDSAGVKMGLKLDALGRVVADTNGLGYVAKHAYGPNADTLYDRKGYITIVIRDVLGRTTSLKDPNSNVTQFFYKLDAASGDERDSVAYPDGTWEVTVTDKGGRTIQKLDKRGVSQSYVYGNDWGVDTMRYEQSGKPTLAIAYARNSKGQVEKVERIEGGNTVSTTEYTFDDAGRVLTQKQTVGADIKATSYAYDLARRSVTLTLPDGTTRTKVLDERGRLDSVYLDGAMIADYFYDNNKHTGTKLGNGIEATYGLDVAGRLTSMAYGNNGQDPILRHELGWDNAGQLVWAKKIPDAIFDERYGLDKQGQLTEWKTGVLDATNGITAPTDSLGWNLDGRGNWINVYDSKKTVDTRTHSGANAVNVRNGVTFVYDAAGNLSNDGMHAYEWTLDGLLAKVSSGLDTVVYIYDGQRRLVSRTAKTAGVSTVDAYVWDGWQLAQEFRSGTANTYAYGRYIDDRIAMKNGSGSYYFHRSYNQTAEAVTDANGELVERYIATNPYGGYVIQDANGNTLAVSSIGNKSVFQGAPMVEPVSGLVYLRNRWYSPSLGRFVSRDPMRYDAGDVNLYRFVGNGPIENSDPLGLETSHSCQIDAYGLGIAWLSGVGGKVNFGQNDCTTQSIASNPAVSRLRDYIVGRLKSQCGQGKCRGYQEWTESYQYEDEPFSGAARKVFRAMKDAVFAMGLIADIGNFVGGFNVDATGDADCKSGDIEILFEAENTTGWSSFTRLPWKPAGPNAGLINDREHGVGATIRETWVWSEKLKIRGNKCACE